MKRTLVIMVLALAAGFALVMPAAAQDAERPVVRGIMFWSATCPHCHYVIEEVLPPLQEQYGDQLDILMIELDSEAKAQLFYAAGAAAGLSPEELGVPMLIVGDRLMMGSAQIPAELPGLIEQHLAAGGVGWPELPGLEAYLPAAAPNQPVEAVAVAEETPSEAALAESNQGISGSVPAFIVLSGMILALVFAGAMLAMARGGGIQPPTGNWVAWSIPVLIAAGLVVAGYLTYVETQLVEAVCGPVGDCNAVQSSSYARLFGVLPVGVLGLIGYLAMLAAWFWGRTGNLTARWLLLGMAAFGVVFSIYLTYLELFVIRAVCLWCLSSAVIMTLLLLAAAAWLAAAWAVPQRRVTGRAARA